MAALPTDTSPPNPAASVRALPGTSTRLLVLDPAHPRPGQGPVVLGQSECLIGRDAVCQISLPISGVGARHATIAGKGRHIVVRAADRRTWLNGFPVTESILRDGDVLVIGPVEFRVRRATAEDLQSELQPADPLHETAGDGPVGWAVPTNVPASAATTGRQNRVCNVLPVSEVADAVPPQVTVTEPAPHVPLPAAAIEAERLELAAIRSDLERQRADVAAEHALAIAEKARFEAARTRFDAEWSDLAAMRSRLEADLSDVSAQRAQMETDRFRLLNDLAVAEAARAELDEIEPARADLDLERKELDRLRAELNADCEKLKGEVRELETRRSQFERDRRQTDAARPQLAAEKERLATERTKCDSDRRGLEATRTGLEALRRELESQQSALDERRKELDSEQSRLEADRPNSESARDDLDTARIDLEASRSQEKSARREIESARDDLESKRRELAADQASLTADRAAFASEQSELESERIRLASEQKRLEADRNEFDASRKRQQAAEADAQAERSRLNAELKSQRAAVESERSQVAAERQSQAADRSRFEGEQTRLEAEKSELAAERDRLVEERTRLETRQIQLERDREQLDKQRLDALIGAHDVPRPDAPSTDDPAGSEGRREEAKPDDGDEGLPSDARSPFDPTSLLAGERPAPFSTSARDDVKSESPEPAFSPFDPARALGAETETAKTNRSNDADRFSRFFRQPRSAAAAVAPTIAPEPPPAPEELEPCPDEPELCPEERLAAEHAEVCQSVSDYMQQLLARNPGARSRGEQPAHAHETASPNSWKKETDSKPAVAALAVATPADLVPQPVELEDVAPVMPRRKRDVKDIRAGVGSLREIANLSARTAVAAHSSRKLRKSVALMLPLTIALFLVAVGILAVLGAEGNALHLACCAAATAVIGGLEMLRTFVKSRRNRKLFPGSEKPGDVASTAAAGPELSAPLPGLVPDSATSPATGEPEALQLAALEAPAPEEQRTEQEAVAAV